MLSTQEGKQQVTNLWENLLIPLKQLSCSYQNANDNKEGLLTFFLEVAVIYDVDKSDSEKYKLKG